MIPHPPDGGSNTAHSLGLGFPQVCPGCDPHLRHAGPCFGNLRTSAVPCRCPERYRPEEEGDDENRGGSDVVPVPGDHSPGRPEPGPTVAVRPAYGTMESLSQHMDGLGACGRRLWRSCGWSDEALDRLWADVKGAGP